MSVPAGTPIAESKQSSPSVFSLFWHLSFGTNSRTMSWQRNHSPSSAKGSRLICSPRPCFSISCDKYTYCFGQKVSAKCPECQCKCNVSRCLQNQRSVNSYSYYLVKFEFFLMSQCCTYALVRLRFKKLKKKPYKSPSCKHSFCICCQKNILACPERSLKTQSYGCSKHSGEWLEFLSKISVSWLKMAQEWLLKNTQWRHA